MQHLFLELVLLISFAIIVYLMAAAIPRLEETKKDGSEGIERRDLPLDKLDEFLIKAKDKSLRKLKILVMKADNLISKQLKSKKE